MFVRMVLACAVIVAACVVAREASSHSWYPMQCCHDKDCHPIDSCEEIEDLPDGKVRWRGMIFDKDRVHPSQDAKCHVCIFEHSWSPKDPPTPMCIFTQQGS